MWMRLSYVGLLSLFISHLASAALPILQGATNSTTTQLAVLTPSTQSLSYTLVSEGSIVRPTKLKRHSQQISPMAVDHVKFEGLKPHKTYTLKVFDEQTATVVDTRELQTLDTEKQNPRIALVSCMKDRYYDMQLKMWPLVGKERPDLILFLGDTVYADREQNSDKQAPFDSQLERLWRRYSETRSMLQIFYQPRLIPSLAIWDDHDYGENNGDSTVTYKDDAKLVFEAFFAQETIDGLEKGPGISSYFSAFGQNFFLLDGRYFRSPKKLPAAEQTHFGEAQTEWFFEKIKNTNQPSWIITGDQFFGDYKPGDSFEKDHPYDFKNFLIRLKALSIPPVLFASGDVHFSEIMEIESSFLGYTTHELTSSGMHCSSPIFWRFFSNPRRMMATAKRNFLVVDVQVTEKNGLYLSLKSVKEKGEIAFKTNLTIEK